MLKIRLKSGSGVKQSNCRIRWEFNGCIVMELFIIHRKFITAQHRIRSSNGCCWLWWNQQPYTIKRFESDPRARSRALPQMTTSAREMIPIKHLYTLIHAYFMDNFIRDNTSLYDSITISSSKMFEHHIKHRGKHNIWGGR